MGSALTDPHTKKPNFAGVGLLVLFSAAVVTTATMVSFYSCLYERLLKTCQFIKDIKHSELLSRGFLYYFWGYGIFHISMQIILFFDPQEKSIEFPRYDVFFALIFFSISLK